MTNQLKRLIRSLPKAELHIHLEGTIRTETAIALAQKYSHLGLIDAVKKLKGIDTFTGIEDFLAYYQLCMKLLRSADDFALAVYEYGQAMFAQNILYSEVHISVYQHLHLFQKGLNLSDIFNGLEKGRQKAHDDFGVCIQWIFGIPRRRHFNSDGIFNPEIAVTVLEYAVQGKECGVIGIGLGGNEVNAPPEPFERVFKKAKEMGFKALPHAGETDGASSVWGALNELQADRICHGVRAIEDEKLVRTLAERKVPLDICPTSNLRINLYPSLREHPFSELEQAGVIVTINSDDPSIFGTTLCDEYLALAKEFDYSNKDLARFARNSFEASFVPNRVKKTALQKIVLWEKETHRKERK